MIGLTNINNANSQQLHWLLTHKCTHRHNYIRHFGCFIKDYDISEKVGFLDIETSNLKANFGIVLCWCVLDQNEDLYEDWMTKKDVMSGIEDSRIVETCVDTMMLFDRVVGHYSTYFDIPFLRTRALIHGLGFPGVGKLYHTDTWKMAKRSLCLHSNRQVVVAESLYGSTVKTRINHPNWRQAMMGNSVAMEDVVDHCEKDVQDLKKNYETLLPFCKPVRSSI